MRQKIDTKNCVADVSVKVICADESQSSPLDGRVFK